MENRDKIKGNQNTIWKILLTIASIIFLAVAASMIIAEQRYYIGALYFITSVLYSGSAYLIAKGQADITNSSSNEQLSLTLGFIIITIALALNGIFWGLGIVLFIAAILSIHKNSD
ncbi:MAG: hypothetical protein ACQESU_00655 [Halobacteriota archaeon]